MVWEWKLLVVVVFLLLGGEGVFVDIIWVVKFILRRVRLIFRVFSDLNYWSFVVMVVVEVSLKLDLFVVIKYVKKVSRDRNILCRFYMKEGGCLFRIIRVFVL